MVTVYRISKESFEFVAMEMPISEMAFKLYDNQKPEHRPAARTCFPHLTESQAAFLFDGTVMEVSA